MKYFIIFLYLGFQVFFSFIKADSFLYNSLNNHGNVGLINMPTARFYDESSFGLTLYDGNPDQKITFMSSPYDWLEASVFYTNIQGKPYPGYEYQDYKDKGFNFKIRLKQEGILPAIAIGMNDIAGTGLYSSEYIVSSYGINNFDFHLGLGWGNLDGYGDLKNPLGELIDDFKNRPNDFEGFGGELDPDRYFSGEKSSAFFGVTYALNEKFIAKLERDTTLTPGLIGYEKHESQSSIGLDYNISKNFTLGLAFERGNAFSLRFSFKDNKESNPPRAYKKSKNSDSTNKYFNLVNNLKDNDIGVNKIVENNNLIGLEITQFKHSSAEIIEEIIYRAKKDSGIESEILVNQKIVNLDAVRSFDKNFIDSGNIVFEKKKRRSFRSSNKLNIRPFIASREGFLKVAALLENNIEAVISDNFIFSSNLKYSLWDNFDDLTIPPVDTYPKQVRSDVKDYLRNFDDGIIIGRAQFDFYKTLGTHNHIMISAGILEEMFNGYGLEYLWFDNSKNFALGFEVFDVYKRDYKLKFGTLDYQNITAHLNFYYRNYGRIPFDAKVTYGEYLAGDIGSTLELSRSFKNGIKFGIFASNTNVSKEKFGEGSFDKGIFFSIPIFGDSINYSWRPLTKDPGQKLIRSNNLHDLLIKFRPIE